MSAIRLGKSVVGLVVALLAIAGIATSSLAAWTARTDGAAGVVADRLGTPGAVAVAAVDQQSLRISWTSPAGPAPTGYVVRRVGSPAATVCTAAVAVGDRLECTDAGLAAGMTYSYTVQAVLHAWQGSESAPASGTTGSAPDTGPRLVSLELFDDNSNGRIDRVAATFDEALQASTDKAPWTLANVPSGGTLVGVSTSGSTATLVIGEGAGPADTAVGSFTVALAANSTGVRDLAGNPASFAATAPTDKAGPVIMALTQPVRNTVGLMESGDTLEITFSEPLNATAGSTMVGLAEPNNGSTSLEALPIVGRLEMGASYLNGSGNRTPAFIGSTFALLNGGRTVRLTLGTFAGNKNAEPRTVTAGGPASLTAAPSVRDLAGNAVPRTLTIAAPVTFF